MMSFTTDKLLRPYLLATVATFALSSCVHQAREAPHQVSLPDSARTPTEPGVYVVAAGHGSDNLAELRAAPPPQLPEVSAGAAIKNDEKKLVAKSYVRIGTACAARDDEAAHAWAMRNGQRVGADKILIYDLGGKAHVDATAAAEFRSACERGSEASTQVFVAVFYVRYRLPFGAQFRDLDSDEKHKVGVSGGVAIGDVIGGTPAAEANLRNGDIVVKLNGTTFANRVAFQNLLRANMGKHILLTVHRDGAQFDRMVRLGILATESPSAAKTSH